MIYLFTYQEIKRADIERRTRSLERLHRSGRAPIDSYSRPRPEPEDADVIELVFATHCESEPIGA